MQKKLYFGTNLKMYKNIADTVSYLQKLAENTKVYRRDFSINAKRIEFGARHDRTFGTPSRLWRDRF